MTVEGNTCWIGTEEYNQGLSQRRADAVRARYIQDYGISADRISIEGYGESRPIADNNTKVGREQSACDCCDFKATHRDPVMI